MREEADDEDGVERMSTHHFDDESIAEGHDEGESRRRVKRVERGRVGVGGQPFKEGESGCTADPRRSPGLLSSKLQV